MLTIDQKKQIQKFMTARRRKLRAPDERDYPKFNSAVMLTSDYVTAYTALNHKRLHLAACAFEPTVNRTPPGLDPAFPEVVMESEE